MFMILKSQKNQNLLIKIQELKNFTNNTHSQQRRKNISVSSTYDIMNLLKKYHTSLGLF